MLALLSADEPEVELKPNIVKSFLKGALLLGVFSLFLQINSSTFVNYLIFVAGWMTVLFSYMYLKGATRYRIEEEKISIKRPFRKGVEINFENIGGMGISQGMIAKRFNCGSVYLELKQGKGGMKSLGGQAVDSLKDVRDPMEVQKLISDRISPFSLDEPIEQPKATA